MSNDELKKMLGGIDVDEMKVAEETASDIMNSAPRRVQALMCLFQMARATAEMAEKMSGGEVEFDQVMDSCVGALRALDADLTMEECKQALTNLMQIGHVVDAFLDGVKKPKKKKEKK